MLCLPLSSLKPNFDFYIDGDSPLSVVVGVNVKQCVNDGSDGNVVLELEGTQMRLTGSSSRMK